MKTTPLNKFCDEFTQQKAAEIMGLTQGAVFQMIRAGRHIYINQHDNGTFEAFEEKNLTKSA